MDASHVKFGRCIGTLFDIDWQHDSDRCQQEHQTRRSGADQDKEEVLFLVAHGASHSISLQYNLPPIHIIRITPAVHSLFI
jgi:hypothetical protein